MVRDANRPNQPPGVVLEAPGSTARTRAEGAGGAKRGAEAKVSDLDLVLTPATVTTGQRRSAPLVADTSIPPQAPVATAAAESAAAVVGSNSATVSKLLDAGDRVLVRNGEHVGAARVVEVAGSTIKLALDGQPPHMAPVKVKRSQVERISQGDVNAAVHAESPERGPRTQTVGGDTPPLAVAEAQSTPAGPLQSGSGSSKPATIALSDGTRAPRQTVESAADLLALRSKRWRLSGYRTQGALKAAIGSNEFGKAVKLLKDQASRAAVQAVLRGRQGVAIPPPTLVNPKKPTAMAQRAVGKQLQQRVRNR